MKQFNYIYLITNKINGKIYIGKHSTNDLNDDYYGSGVLIKRSIQKYGIENFTKEYLAFCDTEEKLNWFEKFYIKKYKAREVGYNLTDGGEGGSPMKGKHHSIKTKEKMRLSHIGQQSFLGKHLTNEHKQHISQSMKGKQNTLGKLHSDETKQKIRESLKKYYQEKNKIKL